MARLATIYKKRGPFGGEEPAAGPGEPHAGLRAGAQRAVAVVALPLALGLGARLALLPFTSWAKDDSIWLLATQNGLQHLGLYQRIGFSYPPYWGYLLQGLGWLLGHLGVTASALGTQDLRFQPLTSVNEFATMVTTPLYNVCFKGLLLVADLGTGLLLYDLCRRAGGDERRARLAFCLWFLNPFVIFATAVYGAFDLFVGFAVLLCAYLFVARRPGWAGASLAVAVMLKGAPIFLAPFFVFVALDRRGPLAERLRGAWPFLGGLGGGLALLLLPLLATSEVHASISAVFARTSGPSFGGYAVTGLMRFAGLSTVTQGLQTWGGLNHAVLALQALASCALGLAGARLARRGLAYAGYSTCALVLAVVVVLGPTANGQYALWFLPAVVAVVALWRRQVGALVLFSALPLGFILTVFGPTVLLFPMAEAGWVTVPAIAHAVRSWGATPPAFWSAQGGATNFTGPAAALGVVGVALLAWGTFARVPRRVASPGPRPARSPLAVATAGILVAAGLLGGLVVAASPATGGVSLTVSTGRGGPVVTARVTPGSRLVKLRLAAVAAGPPLRTVDLYVDPAYPVAGTTLRGVEATADTVANGLHLAGFPGQVREINATGLRRLMANRQGAAGTAVVDLAGALPATVYGPGTDLARPWLEAGGILYFGGEPLGLLSARPAGRGHPGRLVDLGHEGVGRFVDPTAVGHAPRQTSAGTRPSAVAATLALSYVMNGQGLKASRATSVSLLGWLSGRRSSVGSVGIGRGHAVVLGGPVENQRNVSPDIERLVMSAAVLGAPAAYAEVPQSVVDHGGVVRWRLPASTGGSLAVVAFDPSPEGVVFARAQNR